MNRIEYSSRTDLSHAGRSPSEQTDGNLAVVGRGMIAQTARLQFRPTERVLLFAGGTGDASAKERAAFESEKDRVLAALDQCEVENRRLVYCSSAGRIYGQVPDGERVDETSDCNPGCPYGRNKLACEELIRSRPGNHLILRIANLLGPSQNDQQLLPALLRQASQGQVNVHTRATRDLLAIEDLFPIVEELLQNTSRPETVIVATGLATSIKQLLDWITPHMPGPFEITHVDRGQPQAFDLSKLRRIAPRSSDFSPAYPKLSVEAYLAKAILAQPTR